MLHTAGATRPEERIAAVPARRSLSIVIPAYNEERRLPPTLERISEFLAGAGYDGEVIVVDDGSRDRTPDVLAELRPRHPRLRVLRHPMNTGKGFAVRAGVLAATRDAVLLCDADLSTPIEEVDRLWRWVERGYDVVLGSRALPRSELAVKQPLHRRGMGRVFNLLVSLTCVRGIRDTQCGFKLFRSAAARETFGSLKTFGFAFDVEILVRSRRLGHRLAEVPVRWSDMPGSRIRPLRDSCRMAMEIVRIGTRV
ncbi:MAG TPA: dolichyl-phosphate beta-glucosyltransferase [Planctomycetota bacterium]|jgi:dolichyl-phosphate beta-glucosyltransferase|nr:dolichyl-phosphate beta-glucosyltransferase [Planctomycetota bacterium]